MRVDAQAGYAATAQRVFQQEVEAVAARQVPAADAAVLGVQCMRHPVGHGFGRQRSSDPVDQKTIPGLVELVKKLRDRGVTVITIEHNINIIMDISNHVLALDQGKKIAFGQPKEIQNNQKVIDAYLGTVDAA